MKEKCVILISHMFENVTGGAGTYANYLYDSLALNNSNIFDFYLLTHDISHPRKNIISVKVDNEKDSSFYKKMKKYRSVSDDFIMHSGHKEFILHANSALELSNFIDIKAIKIANVNDYEVVNAIKLIPLNIKLYGFTSLRKIAGKLKARTHERKALSSADVVFANSQFTKKCIEDGYKLSDIRTIYKSCNLKLFGKNIDESIIKDKFIFVANDWRRKGLFPLLEAFSLIRDGGYSEASLTLAGIPLKDHLEVDAMIHQLNLRSRVTLLGNLPMNEISDLYRRHKYFIMPSFIEALGITILEAMSCGLIVAVANSGGMPEIVEDGSNGLLIKEINPKGISNILIRMIKLSPVEQSAILSAADRTLSFFNSKRMINEIVCVYDDLFKNRRGR